MVTAFYDIRNQVRLISYIKCKYNIERRWRWIRHILRKNDNNITKVAMHWMPEGKRERQKDHQEEDGRSRAPTVTPTG